MTDVERKMRKNFRRGTTASPKGCGARAVDTRTLSCVISKGIVIGA